MSRRDVNDNEKTNKSNRGGRPRRAGNRKPKDKINDRDIKDTEEIKPNDPSWYYLDKGVADQVSRLSMQNIIGQPSSIMGTAQPVSTCVIPMNPSPGTTYISGGSTGIDLKSAFNLSMFKFYSRLSVASGRSTTYAPQDVGAMILAMGEVISMVEHIRRFFGIAFAYNERNWNYPKAIIDQMGVNSSDFFANMAKYRMQFNTIITRIDALPIPSNVAYFAKCMELYQDLWLDSETPMAQTFVYVPATTWVLREDLVDTGTVLKSVPVYVTTTYGTPVKATGKTMADLLNILDQQISALYNSATLAIVYSDILNMAGKNEVKLLKLDYLLDGYMVLPKFSHEKCMIFQNTINVGLPALDLDDSVYTQGLTPANDVYPDPDNNQILYNPMFAGYNTSLDRVLVNYTNGDPDVDERLVSLRYMCANNGTSVIVSDTNYAVNMILPDHYAVAFFGFYGNRTTAINDYFNNWWTIDVIESQRAAYWLQQFDYHPYVFVSSTSYPTARNVTNILGDLDYYTTVDAEYLRRVLNIVNTALFDFRI